MRDTNAQEDKMLSNNLKEFERDIDKFKEVNDKIDAYARSNKESEIESVEEKLTHNAEDIEGGEHALSDLKPLIEDLKKQVENR